MNLQLLTNAINQAKWQKDKFYFSNHAVTVSFTPYVDEIEVHEFLYKIKNNWVEIEPTEAQLDLMQNKLEVNFENSEIVDKYDYYGVDRLDFY